jgi:hypothetical protein
LRQPACGINQEVNPLVVLETRDTDHLGSRNRLGG